MVTRWLEVDFCQRRRSFHDWCGWIGSHQNNNRKSSHTGLAASMSLRVQTDVDPALEPLAPKNRAIRHGTSVTLGSDLNDPPIVYRLTSRFPMKLYLTVIAVVLLTSCSEPSAPEPGSIRVSISTAGGDQDQNGYRVLIGSERVQSIATQGSILIENIPAGTHALTMDGIADNCILAGPQSRPVTVASV